MEGKECVKERKGGIRRKVRRRSVRGRKEGMNDRRDSERDSV